MSGFLGRTGAAPVVQGLESRGCRSEVRVGLEGRLDNGAELDRELAALGHPPARDDADRVAHAFEAWGCRRVELKTDALNERSRRAIEALGATFEGVHRQHMLVREAENRDTAWYSVLDAEWPAVRERLRARLAGRWGHVLAIGIFSAFILHDLKRVRDGDETNYISATLGVYLSLYNVFQSLLALLGIFGGSRE